MHSQFTALESKIRRLEELKADYLTLVEQEEALFREAHWLSGEQNENGHILEFMANDPDMTAAELFERITRNPSHLWDPDTDPDRATI